MTSTDTLTNAIFKLNTPYDNPYQGKDKRLLFVCSAGLLRSATAANLYAKKGYNTRSCGSSSYALIPLSINLIQWAQKIFFVNNENYLESLDVFESEWWGQEITGKSQILSIPDKYPYNHPELLKMLEEQIEI